MQSTQTDVKEYSYFAGNQWQKAADNRVFEVHEPYSKELFARVAAGTRTDARAAGIPRILQKLLRHGRAPQLGNAFAPASATVQSGPDRIADRNEMHLVTSHSAV